MFFLVFLFSRSIVMFLRDWVRCVFSIIDYFRSVGSFRIDFSF